MTALDGLLTALRDTADRYQRGLMTWPTCRTHLLAAWGRAEQLGLQAQVLERLADPFDGASYRAKLAGSVKSDRKAAASRANGQKGGRPKKATELPVTAGSDAQ